MARIEDPLFNTALAILLKERESSKEERPQKEKKAPSYYSQEAMEKREANELAKLEWIQHPTASEKERISGLRAQKEIREKRAKGEIPPYKPPPPGPVVVRPLIPEISKQLPTYGEERPGIQAPHAIRKFQGTTCGCQLFTDEAKQKMAKMLACESPDEPGTRKKCVERIAPIEVKDGKYILGKSHIGAIGNINLARLNEIWAGLGKDDETEEIRTKIESVYRETPLIGKQGVFGTALNQGADADRVTEVDIMQMLFHKPDCYCKGKKSTEGDFIREEVLCFSSDVALGETKLLGEIFPTPSWLEASRRIGETVEEAEARAERTATLNYPIFTPKEGQKQVMELALFDAVRLFPSAITTKYGGDKQRMKNESTLTEKAVARVLVEAIGAIKRVWTEPYYEGKAIRPPKADEMQPCTIQLGYHRKQRKEKTLGVDPEPMMKAEEPTPGAATAEIVVGLLSPLLREESRREGAMSLHLSPCVPEGVAHPSPPKPLAPLPA